MRLTKTKSIGSGQDPESQAGRQSDGYGGWCLELRREGGMGMTMNQDSKVHNQIATFGLFSRQSVTLNIGLNISCSHNRDNRPSEQSAKCTIGQALSSSWHFVYYEYAT